MNNYPIIKKITFNRYKFPIENMRRRTISWIDEPTSKAGCNVISIKIDTDFDVSEEYFSVAPGTYDQMRTIPPLVID